MLDKEWMELRKTARKAFIKHQTSASSLKTYKSCRRQWWLNKIRKLRTKSSQANIIGTVTHSICERFLQADDQGYDRETRKPVDLYPAEWHIARNTYPEHREDCPGHRDHEGFVQYADVDCDCPHPIDGELSITEQAMIKRLISEAIDAGVLERHPGREIEAKIRYDAFHDEDLGDLSWIGYIDVREPDMIQDHKTAARMKYALSKAKLFDDLQMNLYGYHSVFVRAEADPNLEKLWLRHNVYCKDKNDSRVRKTEVEKPVEKIRDYYEKEIEPCFREMLLLIKNTDTWSDIEPPVDIASACNTYGGCPFLSICSGGETLDMFIRRTDRAERTGSVQKPKTKNQEETMKMNLLDKKKNKKANGTPVTTTAKVEETKPQETAPATETATNAAPWYIPGCRACSDNPNPGIGSNGQPCMVCVTKNQGKVSPKDFKQVVGEDGSISWVSLDSGEVAVVDKTQSDKKVKVEEVVATDAEVEAKKESDKAVADKKAESQLAADKKEAEKRAKGKEKELPSEAELGLSIDSAGLRKKFTLIIGGTSADGTMSSASKIGNAGRIVTLEELLKIVGEHMGNLYSAKIGSDQVINFFDINAFERRDFMAAHASDITDILGNSAVACSRVPTPDENALLSALRPLAFRVFVCT